MTRALRHACLPIAVALLLGACAGAARDTPPPAPQPAAAGDTRSFSGAVQAIDNGCFADGTCSVTVDGTVVVTMTGWSRDTWGPRDPDVKIGDQVQVRCRVTAEGCTLNGSAGYFLRAQR